MDSQGYGDHVVAPLSLMEPTLKRLQVKYNPWQLYSVTVPKNQVISLDFSVLYNQICGWFLICLFARQEERGKRSSSITKVTVNRKALKYKAMFHHLVSLLMLKSHQ